MGVFALICFILLAIGACLFILSKPPKVMIEDKPEVVDTFAAKIHVELVDAVESVTWFAAENNDFIRRYMLAVWYELAVLPNHQHIPERIRSPLNVVFIAMPLTTRDEARAAYETVNLTHRVFVRNRIINVLTKYHCQCHELENSLKELSVRVLKNKSLDAEGA